MPDFSQAVPLSFTIISIVVIIAASLLGVVVVKRAKKNIKRDK